MNLEIFSLFPELTYDREYFAYGAGILVAVVAIGYAIQVHREKLHINTATWLMILAIDVLGLTLAFGTGNSNPIIHIAWVISDTLICIAAITLHKRFYWSRIDTFSLIFFLLALAWWHLSTSLIAVIGYLVACFFTLLPQAIQYWHNKHIAQKSAWIWLMSSGALVLTIFSLHTLTLEYAVVSFGLLTLYLGMVMIALR